MPQALAEGAEGDGDLEGDGELAGPRNVRNGSRPKTVLTDAVGKVTVQVPRDRDGLFEPVIVGKHQRKLGSVEAVVLSLTAKGLTSGEISAHLEEIYGASVSKDTIPFLDYNVEIRRILFSTNAIESLNARYRRAVKARGHFPNEQATLKCLYMVTRSLDPTGKGAARWVTRWKPALNVFATTFEGRWPTAEKY